MHSVEPEACHTALIMAQRKTSQPQRFTDVSDFLDERASARASRDWAASDRLRDALADRGIAVEDTRDGQRWHRIAEVSRG